jgi:CheY-like chemotaxis protein
MDTDLPVTVFSDVNRLQQILKNLLSNAFKFTNTGGVTLTVQRSRRDAGDGVLSFSVRDTGIGIPQEKQKLIFEAFQQADGTTSRKYGGTGLGLTISREIARLLGGSIDVVSAPNQGSTFTLHLPIRYAGAEALHRHDEDRDSEVDSRTAVPALPRNAKLSGLKVVIVDDDVRNLFALQSVLEERGIQVLHADNGRVAIEILQQHQDVDLVLMDTMMPEMDGLSATRAIRDIVRYRSMPIISLTAKAMKGDREKAIEAGATDYVTKPVDSERLLAVIHYWVKATRDSQPSLAS